MPDGIGSAAGAAGGSVVPAGVRAGVVVPAGLVTGGEKDGQLGWMLGWPNCSGESTTEDIAPSLVPGGAEGVTLGELVTPKRSALREGLLRWRLWLGWPSGSIWEQVQVLGGVTFRMARHSTADQDIRVTGLGGSDPGAVDLGWSTDGIEQGAPHFRRLPRGRDKGVQLTSTPETGRQTREVGIASSIGDQGRGRTSFIGVQGHSLSFT
jgi:hypothetical protein